MSVTCRISMHSASFTCPDPQVAAAAAHATLYSTSTLRIAPPELVLCQKGQGEKEEGGGGGGVMGGLLVQIGVGGAQVCCGMEYGVQLACCSLRVSRSFRRSHTHTIAMLLPHRRTHDLCVRQDV